MATDYSINGRYAEQCLRGNLFTYQVPSQAILIAATTGAHATVINPLGSNKVFIPVALTVGYISGTLVVGSVLIAETLAVGSQAATGAAIPTATLVAAKSARRGAGITSAMQFSPTVNTFTAAPTVVCGTGISYNTTALELTPTTVFFNGMLAFEPGTAMSVVYSVTTSTALFWMTIFGIELQYPNL